MRNRYRYVLYVESSDGTWSFMDGHPDELRAYKPGPGETTRLLRKWGLHPEEWT